MSDRLMNKSCLAIAAIAAILALTTGCGSGGTSKGPVKGKVTFNGQPVTGGSISLTPAGELKATIAGGEVGADGTFVITTEKQGDGAAIGKHTVGYAAPPMEQPEWDGYGKAPEAKVSPYAGLTPTVTEFEVKAGQNELNIELAPARGGYGGVPGR